MSLALRQRTWIGVREVLRLDDLQVAERALGDRWRRGGRTNHGTTGLPAPPAHAEVGSAWRIVHLFAPFAMAWFGTFAVRIGWIAGAGILPRSIGFRAAHREEAAEHENHRCDAGDEHE